MRQEDTTNITTRCFHGEPASCSHPCPFFFDVRTFLARVRDGKWGLAYKLYRNAAVFPAIVSELCEAPCRAECQRGAGTGHTGNAYFVGDEPVDIRAVEAASVKYAKDRKPESYRIAPRDQRVAVVGAGLAGLSLALNLAQKAYPVTVFERGEQALQTWAAHPKHAYFLEEIRLQFSEVRIEFVFGCEIKGPDDPALEGFSYVHDATANEGVDAVAAIANGVDTSKAVETLLQTGKWPHETPGGAADPVRPEKHYISHVGEPGRPMAAPADPASGYTKEEAVAEASRCMGCDCRLCMDSCEMLGRYNKRPQKIAIEAYTDTKAVPPFSTCSLTRETYSCNLCGYCKSVCPVDVDLEKLFHLARTGRAETGKHPRAFHDFWLRDFEWHRTAGAYFAPHTAAKYLFFPGCKLGARSPSQLRAAAAFLMERYGAGALLDCCGAPAWWAGEDALFREQLGNLRAKWEAAGKPIFVYACAYCMKLFGSFLPEIEKISLYELLAESGIHAASEKTAFAVFDPCTARDFPEMETAVRKLAAGAGIVPAELPERNHCCGFGGHMRAANPGLYDTIAGRRASADGAPYLVYCANCADTFALSGKAHAHILDLVFPADGDACPDRRSEAARDGQEAGSRVPALQMRRDNATLAKTALAELYGDEAPAPATGPRGAVRIEIPPALAADLDTRLILADDIREAIYEAERTGEIFALAGGAPGGGELRQCRLAGNVVTIWVQYAKRSEGGYNVIDAWAHRMRFSDKE